jgi:hypothetical protein
MVKSSVLILLFLEEFFIALRCSAETCLIISTPLIWHISGLVTSVRRMEDWMNYVLKDIEGERFWQNLRYYCGMLLDGIRKIMTNLSGYLFTGRRFEFETWLICIKGRWPEMRGQHLPHCMWVWRYASMHVYICKLWIAGWINTCVEEKFNTPIFCHIHSA